MLTADDNVTRLDRDLRQAILDGSLAPSTRLMSVRALAGKYGLSYGRALRVLKKLEKQGLLVSRHGGGTFVAENIQSKSPAPNIGLLNRSSIATIIAPRNYWKLGESVWFNGFIRGFEARIHQYGGSVEMTAIDDFLASDKRTGIFVLVSHLVGPQVGDVLQSIAATRQNVIMVGSDPVFSSWALTMDIDGASGIDSALQHLFEFGHRKIALASWDYTDDLKPHTEWWLREREGAYTALMKARKLEPLVTRLPFPGQQAEAPSDRLDAAIGATLEKNAGVTAVVCVNDALAHAFLNYSSRYQVKIPENLSLVGFDDDPWAVSVGLTTLARPYRELGESAAGLVLQAVSNPLIKLRGNLAIAPQLVKRNTVRAV